MEVTTTTTSNAGQTTAGVAQPAGSSGDPAALQGLELDDFFQLMIAELQNQDPLNPLENDEFLAQIATIQEIEATTQLGDALDALALGQNLNSGSALIGKEITALADDGANVQGVVSRVTINGSDVTLHVGEQQARLNNIREILPASED
ncbi:MAG: flagellar biosynthesis protein FlgD [Pirellulales bacterium]|nr:flagellar biosynthesis protein FlgD [Pirellulales bacterium]